MSKLFKYLPPLIALLSVGAVVGYLVYKEQTTERPDEIKITTAGFLEMCLSCHKDEKPDPAHAAHMVGCSPCHLGD
ncbi:hypothetical protein VU04_01850, partial [Desulfobulbus sp. TB]|nr:hypothetical protein [Desulfobulbus sp. TB]